MKKHFVVAGLLTLALAGCGHGHSHNATPPNPGAACKPAPYDMMSEYHSTQYYEQHQQAMKKLLDECKHAPCIADGSSPNCSNAAAAQFVVGNSSGPSVSHALSKALTSKN